MVSHPSNRNPKTPCVQDPGRNQKVSCKVPFSYRQGTAPHMFRRHMTFLSPGEVLPPSLTSGDRPCLERPLQPPSVTQQLPSATLTGSLQLVPPSPTRVSTAVAPGSRGNLQLCTSPGDPPPPELAACNSRAEACLWGTVLPGQDEAEAVSGVGAEEGERPDLLNSEI